MVVETHSQDNHNVSLKMTYQFTIPENTHIYSFKNHIIFTILLFCFLYPKLDILHINCVLVQRNISKGWDFSQVKPSLVPRPCGLGTRLGLDN